MSLPTRWVMAPMTRNRAPGGVPTPAMAEYYRRRAEGGIGLVITEGTLVEFPFASAYPDVPVMNEETKGPWKRIVDAVHRYGVKILVQLWHCGPEANPGIGAVAETRSAAHVTRAATPSERDGIIDAFRSAAVRARSAGFDGVELHAAHGYLLDSFMRAGDSQFVAAVVRAIRADTSRDFKICLRFSPWRVNDLAASYLPDPESLRRLLVPLSEASTDLFHASLRRYWESPFGSGDLLSLAGWTRRLTGRPTIVVGNIGLSSAMFFGDGPGTIADLGEKFGAGHFDLVAVGRPLITQPDWVRRAKFGDVGGITDFQPGDQNRVFD